jgi:hypothetical protein
LYLMGSLWLSLVPDTMAVIFGLIASATSIFETVRIWKEKLF